MANQKYEQWKTIPGFDGIYQVSSLGRVYVKNCVRVRKDGQKRCFGAKYLRSKPKRGYPWVILCHPRTQKRRYALIHILVAEAFLGPRPSSKHEVNHKDGNKQNFCVDNLEWVIASENCRHAYRIGLKKWGVFIEHNGKRQRATDWSRELGIAPQTIFTRIKAGHLPDEILDPTGGKVRKKANINISNGNKKAAPKYKNGLSAIEWAEILKISRAAFLWRIHHYSTESLIYRCGRYPRNGPVRLNYENTVAGRSRTR